MKNIVRFLFAVLLAVPAIPMLAQPELDLSVSTHRQRLDPGEHATFTVTVRNFSATPATNVALSVTLPDGGTMLGGVSKSLDPASCSVANNALLCTAPALSNEQSLIIEVSFAAPVTTNGGDFAVNTTVVSAEQDADPANNQDSFRIALYRAFVVSRIDDEGSGSLRQAMLDVNALCPIAVPCSIVFQIPGPVPESGWFTIQPRTPLPEVVASVKIDGNTQTLFTGDTNPRGPEIEINGALLPEQSGLRLRPNCDVEVGNLAVNHFPGYGVVVRRVAAGSTDPCFSVAAFSFVNIHGNYLGTDPRGETARPNNRGLGLFTDESTVTGNLISGNRRSGIYIDGGFYSSINDNRIGVSRGGEPLGNGAGIFLNLGSDSGADVKNNVIAYNDGMAIARTRNGEIQITRNFIFDNLQQGIDVDVDGPTPQRAEDRDVPNAPVLFSAEFDPVRGATIVRGRVDSKAGSPQGRFIDVYSSTRLSVWSTPQAEEFVLGPVFLPAGTATFEIVVPEDLRGKWITTTFNAARFTGFARAPRRGIATQNHFLGMPTNTSELSNAVMAR